MGAQRLVATRLVGAGVVVEIAERRGEAVGAVLGRHAAEGPERVLQTDRECREALAAEHRLGMLPGGVGQDEGKRQPLAAVLRVACDVVCGYSVQSQGSRASMLLIG